MGRTVIGGDVGIRLANDVDVEDIQDPTDAADISGAAYLGALRYIPDDSEACTTYKTITGVDGITVSNMKNVEQVITPTGTVHNLPIYIKDGGEGSFSVPFYILASTTQVDAAQLLWAAENLPNGVTGTIGNGSPGTADEAAEYNPWEDTTTNYGFGDGYAGYNIIIESSYTNSAGLPRYHQTFFDNCFIKPGYGVNPQQAGQVTIEFTARRTRVLHDQESTLLA